jgi:sortase A
MTESDADSALEGLVDHTNAESATEALRAPPTPRRALRIIRGIGWTFIYIGVLILGFVAHQLFVTDFFAERAQRGLEEEFALRVDTSASEEFAIIDPETGEVVEVEGGDPGDIDGARPGDGPPVFQLEESPDLGDAMGIIRIPEIDLEWTIVEGVRIGSDLRKGAGHYPDTPIPGQPGNAAVAGHRTTYGAPFHNLDNLEPGDLIEFETVTGVHIYEVRGLEIVDPTAVEVLNPREGGWLTLTTCHPKFSARQRLIVTAEIVGGPNAEAIQAGGELPSEVSP